MSNCISDVIRYGAVLVRKYQWKCLTNDYKVSISLQSLKIENSIQEKLLSIADTQWIGYETFFEIFSEYKSIYFHLIKHLHINYRLKTKHLNNTRIETLKNILKLEKR